MEPIHRLYYRPEPLYRPPLGRENVLWRNPPRKLFLEAITRVTPEVVERLLNDVSPFYPKSEALREHTLSWFALSGIGSKPDIREEFKPLRQAIDEWTVASNLGTRFWYPGPHWLHECGLYTLAIHAGYLEPPVEKAIAVKLPYNTDVSLTLETDGTATLKFKALDPYTRKFGRYYSSNMQSIEIAMQSYVSQLEEEYFSLCFEESSTDKYPQHWEWLALRLVRRWTYDAIADKFDVQHGKPIDPGRVGEVVRKNRAAIGFYE